ncbi:hypothetical protein E1212_19425 [Jiangella ureilytica]|uniref:DUF3558 domain-containing protein n=1 Tax=Jiangella ureilytica TaxID=2530374 RepID=A0A4R4RHQ8_9ACTN|nr:hypothetical protein [Jiangella ureilytica]TDC49028.1 hypothetical protein E1212_19425 [Jiangella ureilytica]
MRHFGWIVVAAPVAALLLAACGDEEAPVSASPSDAPSSDDSGRLYTGIFTVLENAEHGPQLCTAVASSLPPQCGGPDVAGWNWDEAPDAETVDGVTWGFYSVTGTWDGTTLTLTEPPLAGAATSPMVPDDALPDFTTPCEPPPGGWAVVDPATATDAGQASIGAYTGAQADWAGTWIDTSVEPAVLNVRFTGDLERHEAELRSMWGGPLCVSAAERSMRELTAIQEELVGSVPHLTSVGPEATANVVLLDVFVDDGLQEQLDQQYGPGVVRVSAALRPAE